MDGMTRAELLYSYAKLYNQYNVKAVLIRENWNNSDFDVKYARYLQEYVQLKEQIFKGRYSGGSIEAALVELKRRRICAAYDFLFNAMKSGLEREKGSLSPQKEEAIKKRLRTFMNPDDVDFEYLYELRKIEEEEY